MIGGVTNATKGMLLRVANSAAVADQRRAPRYEVSFRAWLARAGHPRIAIHAVDMSQHGLMARTSAAVQPGETVTLDLPLAGKHEAIVRWSLGGRIGCELGQPLPDLAWHRLLAEPPAAPSPWARF